MGWSNALNASFLPLILHLFLLFSMLFTFFVFSRKCLLFSVIEIKKRTKQYCIKLKEYFKVLEAILRVVLTILELYLLLTH
jgi:hypothetical protein